MHDALIGSLNQLIENKILFSINITRWLKEKKSLFFNSVKPSPNPSFNGTFRYRLFLLGSFKHIITLTFFGSTNVNK